MSGHTWKWIHFVSIFFFVGLWAVATYTGWVYSVVFVSHVSMIALVLAAISSWQGARTEEKQDNQIKDNEQRDDNQDKVLGTNEETDTGGSKG